MSGYPDPNKPQYNPYGDQPQYPPQQNPAQYGNQYPTQYTDQGYPQINPQQTSYTGYSSGDDSSSGIPGWLIWIGVIIGLNVLSAVFDWGYYFY